MYDYGGTFNKKGCADLPELCVPFACTMDRFGMTAVSKC